MKVAYIFFGQVKNYNTIQHEAWLDNVSPVFARDKVDFYLVTSKNNIYSNLRNVDSEGLNVKINHNSILDFFKFKEVYYDGLEDSNDINQHINTLSNRIVDQFGGAWGENSLQSTINSIKQLYSLEYFYNQFNYKDNYDLFVLSRSDLFHNAKLSGEEISKIKSNVCLVPDFGWWKSPMGHKGYNDRFAIFKNNNILKTYCTRYLALNQDPQYYHSESFLYKILLKDGFQARAISGFDFRLLRANNVITDFIGRQIDKELTEKYYGKKVKS